MRIQNLQRVTSGGRFIPKIDGLRFIAIFSVFLYHVHKFAVNNYPFDGIYGSFKTWGWVDYLFSQGKSGVELFFVISGFILALPFAKFYLKDGKKVHLKNFYLRRLTRLEPPYIIGMVIFFLMWVFILKKFTFNYLFPHLAASLLYVHNIFYDGLPVVNGIAWSLEIEVQFYLIAPLLMMVLKLPKRLRRPIIGSSILIFGYLSAVWINSNPVALLNYLQYFLIGILMADIYVSTDKIETVPLLIKIAGILSFIAIWFCGSVRSEEYSAFRPLLQVTQCVLIFSFYYAVIIGNLWNQFLENTYISTIGGMCYSIYLLHTIIILFVGRLCFKYSFTHSLIGDWILLFLVCTLAVTAISVLYFKWIERPCMEKDWYIKLWYKLIGRKEQILRKSIVETKGLPAEKEEVAHRVS